MLSGCNSGSNSSSTELTDQATLQNKLNELVTNGGPPGAIALVQVNNNEYVFHAGYADVSKKTEMSENAPFRIGSVSKVYSGTAVTQLVQEKKIHWTDTIGHLLPSLPQAWHSATISQVLQHTSGIPDYIKSPTFLSQFSSHPTMERTPQQLVDYVAHEPLKFTPGSKYEYSDTDNIVAGMIVEHVSGKSYNEKLNHITEPLGLNKTTLPSDPALPADAIRGYTDVGTDKPKDISEIMNPGLAWASGGMLSTAHELNVYVRALLEGKVGDAASLTDPVNFVEGAGGPPGPGKNFSGRAIYRYETDCGVVYGHTGNLPGYTTFIASDEAGGKSVVVGVNTQINEQTTDLYQRLLAVENQAICSMNGVPANVAGQQN